MSPFDTPGALDEGCIVWFHFLHLDSIPPNHLKVFGPDYNKNYMYIVGGKPRLMLVLGKIRDGFDGVRWYHVLKLTTKKESRCRYKHHEYKRLGEIVPDGEVSYTDGVVHAYPDNLAESVRHRLDPFTLTNVLKVSGVIQVPPHASA